MAKLYFMYGSMNSGKSTNLLQVAYNYYERGMTSVIIKPEVDTKGDDEIVSRLGVTRKVDRLIAEEDNMLDILFELKDEVGEIHCILVDEAQFLTANQVDELFEIAVMQDIPVMAYGLRTDFTRKGFEGSTRLLEIAHTLQELKTICKCGIKAVNNARKVNGEYVFHGDQVSIDGENNVTYETLCGKCYSEAKQKQESK